MLIDSIAFVTPTFRPDLERCTLLVESMNRLAADFKHYLIVDHAEIPAFRHLQNSRTVLIESEEILDRCFVQFPAAKGYWLTYRTLPVRGWMIQQILKLGAVRVIPEEVFVVIDSDNTLVRPFRTDCLLQDGKLGLLDVDGVVGKVPIWTKVARDLVGSPADCATLRGHVGDMITWHRQHVLDLQERIEATTGLPWQIAIARKHTFSEYILYGVYIREVIGYEASRHNPTIRPLVRQPWDHDLSNVDGLRHFIVDIEPENVAVMVSSQSGITAASTRPFFEAAWLEAA